MAADNLNAPNGSKSVRLGQDQSVSSKWIGPERARRLDDGLAGILAGLTGGIPPPRIAEAYVDWSINLLLSPGRQLQIVESLLRDSAALVKDGLIGAEPPPSRHYAAAGWKRRPFSVLAQAATRAEALVDLATAPLPGMQRHNAELVRFYSKQVVTALRPENFPHLNPEVWATTRAERGRNLLRGAKHLAKDFLRNVRGKNGPVSERFQVGETLATTPGKVILRNDLIELIQYSPTTPKVHAEPILIVPAWIMKYYILDLSPHNSMVRWLVEQGHTVFAISWKNPCPEDRDLAMEDYRQLGIHAALDAINAVVPNQKVHATGYCVGGTLLALTAAAMARDQDNRLKTVTLFTAQSDFEDAGELKLFVDEMTLYWLDQVMAKRGVLDAKQMVGAFSMLRAQDLIWGPLVERYCLGKRNEAFDIMAWNADSTRMPYRMHSDYLRDLYLENKLAQGKYSIGGRPVSLGDLSIPLFCVGTVTDHVAPWQSVYKIRNLKHQGKTTFVLTTGGHNAGIVNEPGRPRRSYQIGSWDESSPYVSAEEWAQSAERHEGSWWLAWKDWLTENSGPLDRSPPRIGNRRKGYSVLGDAPGTYVTQK